MAADMTTSGSATGNSDKAATTAQDCDMYIWRRFMNESVQMSLERNLTFFVHTVKNQGQTSAASAMNMGTHSAESTQPALGNIRAEGSNSQHSV